MRCPTLRKGYDNKLGHMIEVAAQSALQALKALGYQGLSLDLAVRGVCVDCATAASAAPMASEATP